MGTKKLERLAMKALRREFPHCDVKLKYANGHVQYYLNGHCVATCGSSPDDEQVAINRVLKDARRAYRQKGL